MIDKQCSKHFPKRFNDETRVDDEGYPVYRQRDNGSIVEKSGVHLDNRYVVPYNAELLLKYQGHINVEWSCEAIWRIFGFSIHYQTPAVERLSFHLPGEQIVLFNDHADVESTQREWTPRANGFTIGRIYHVSPGSGEKFYLRTLLNFVKGATCYDDIRTVDGLVYPTFKEVCYARELLDDNKEYVDAITEASFRESGSLRDIMRFVDRDNLHRPFGGIVIVFGADLRQILPVVPKGTRQDIVFATVNSSYLWDSCKVLRLTPNMRLQSEWILIISVGDGNASGPNDGKAVIEIAKDILIHPGADPISAIVESTYPDLREHIWEAKYFQKRAILALTNEIVEIVNDNVLSTIPGEERVYLSSYAISKEEGNFGVHEI
ncbi:uncharacterized protein LOC125493635 [Beta vulgaris subsp. vulgaris]|uniref:uncharacterized protein LOC125493635 n=1 Tax=Beta vulgaris subsp. vulgaris TaxID=3555 RepID=UPI0020375B40|nr:uncharacterized protein LOC125493635 [Beta vulgaris subsp. vulgaris]